MPNVADVDPVSFIPEMFCWTKYGTEAGEDSASILARKEVERGANGGAFLWGIGNAVGPSIETLLERTSRPQVLFTPMLGRPARRDIEPRSIALWHSGVGLDGHQFVVPADALVTSRAGLPGRAHYALVCRRHTPLTYDDSHAAYFTAAHLRNLRSGSRVGASQVTSVVKRIFDSPDQLQTKYRVAFTADLVPPYLVKLTQFSLVGRDLGAMNRWQTVQSTGS